MYRTTLLGLGLSGLVLVGCRSAPVAMDDHVAVGAGETTHVSVLSNDRSPKNEPLFVKEVWGADMGRLTLNPDNTITYTADPGARGTDTISYRVQGRKGPATTGHVHIDVTEPTTAVILGTPEAVIVTPETRVIERERVVVPERTTIVEERVVVPERVIVKEQVVTPVRVPMVDRVLVNLRTIDDDKNRDEAVRIVVRRGAEVLAETSAGRGELWGAGAERSIELNLTPDVPLTDVGQLSIDVIKSAAGMGTGGGWNFRPEVLGRTADGSMVTLLETGEMVKLGDGSPKEVTFSVPMR